MACNLYRKDMELICTFVEIPDGVRIDCEQKFEVVNPTNHKINFRQQLKFEKSERAELQSVSCSGRTDEYGRGARLTEQVAEEGEVLAWTGRPVAIPPQKQQRRIWFRSEFSVTRHIPDFHEQHFVQPTIGFTLRLRSKPEKLRITASPADSQREAEWIYSRLFMPGEHIEIRWERNIQNTPSGVR